MHKPQINKKRTPTDSDRFLCFYSRVSLSNHIKILEAGLRAISVKKPSHNRPTVWYFGPSGPATEHQGLFVYQAGLGEVTHSPRAVLVGGSTCLHLSSWLPSPGSEAAVPARPEKSSPDQLWRVWGWNGGEVAIGQTKKSEYVKKKKRNKSIKNKKKLET